MKVILSGMRRALAKLGLAALVGLAVNLVGWGLNLAVDASNGGRMPVEGHVRLDATHVAATAATRMEFLDDRFSGMMMAHMWGTAESGLYSVGDFGMWVGELTVLLAALAVLACLCVLTVRYVNTLGGGQSDDASDL